MTITSCLGLFTLLGDLAYCAPLQAAVYILFTHFRRPFFCFKGVFLGKFCPYDGACKEHKLSSNLKLIGFVLKAKISIGLNEFKFYSKQYYFSLRKDKLHFYSFLQRKVNTMKILTRYSVSV